ncbi:antioxidant, AhpC/TSA family [[Eubacterium] yurii subsp. margaretiae ATCC 43715]|jgi:thiol-disulfide oxidoreductase resA|nr:antioxidant, AhpC/TSA family [[Eubacterium] yurii subsp. margaretiae ATCC 43715]
MIRSKIFSYLIILSIFILASTSCNKQDISQENIKKDKKISNKSENTKELFALDFSLKDQHANSHSLSKYKGKTVILIFWATWCPDCLEELPDIERLYKEYQLEKNENIVILGINTPNREVETDVKGITAFMQKNNYTFPTLMDEDGKVFESYDIRTYPTTYFIDRNGKISRCIKEIMHYDDMKKSIEMSFNK